MPVCRSRCATTGVPSYRRGEDGDDDDALYASALLLPLAARGEAIGLVELCDTAPRDYVARRSIAERLAKVAAGAVLLIGERRRLGARERVADELIELGDAVARAGTLPELVRPIAALLLASVEAVDCEIWRLEDGRMTCLASVDDHGWDEATVGTSFEVADYPWYLVAFEARAAKVFTPDDGLGLAPFASEASRGRGYRSTLSLPLVADGRPLGCVDLHDRRERDFGEALEFARGVERAAGRRVPQGGHRRGARAARRRSAHHARHRRGACHGGHARGRAQRRGARRGRRPRPAGLRHRRVRRGDRQPGHPGALRDRSPTRTTWGWACRPGSTSSPAIVRSSKAASW